MVVLAAAVITKQGKTLLSRQFVDMSRIRVEGLLSAFTKLMDTSRQYTYFETDTVRYLYQPIQQAYDTKQQLYLVMITNRSSNIVEDLDTLRLLGRLIPENCPSTDESDISANSFELLFSFDEVVQLGYRENVSLEQVANNLKMDSQEAKLAEAMEKSKREAAQQLASQEATRIRFEKKRGGTTGGISSKDFADSMMDDDSMGMSIQTEPVSKEPTIVSSAPKAKKPAGSGMKLGSKGGKLDLVSKMKKRGEIEDTPSPTSAPPAFTAAAPTHTAGIKTETFHLKIDEKISAVLNREGGCSSVEVKGDAVLTVTDVAVATAKIRLKPLNFNTYAFKTHPNINKQFFNKDSVLALKDPSKPFPTGTKLSVLRWRLQNPQGFQPPLTITCWPGDSSCTIEYELEGDISLNNVTVVIPMPCEPSVESIECGEYQFDARNSQLVWNIGTVDSDNSQGSMECDLSNDCSADDFFPIAVNFFGEDALAGVKAVEVTSTENGSPVPYSTEVVLSTERYEVE